MCEFCSLCGETRDIVLRFILQRVVEDSSHVLVTARVEAEKRKTNLRLREGQDAAHVCFLSLLVFTRSIVISLMSNFVCLLGKRETEARRGRAFREGSC